MAEQVQVAVMHQLEELAHTEELVNSLASGSGIVVTVAICPEAFDLANHYAPEHLCLLVDQPETIPGSGAKCRRRFPGGAQF